MKATKIILVKVVTMAIAMITGYAIGCLGNDIIKKIA
jgi:hypothetical protein